MGKFDHLIGREIENGYCSWDLDKTLLYPVGVGAGLDDNLKELQFTTENAPGITQKVLPTFMVLMSAGGYWIPLPIDFHSVLNPKSNGFQIQDTIAIPRERKSL